MKALRGCCCFVYSATATTAPSNSSACEAFLSQSDGPSCSNLHRCRCRLDSGLVEAAAAAVVVGREACC